MLSGDDWRLHFTQWNHLITLPVRNIVDDQLAVGRRRMLDHCLIRIARAFAFSSPPSACANGFEDGFSMKIATWNVNGIRARQSQIGEWLARDRLDIGCLQEL